MIKSDQMWQAYKILNPTIGDKIDAWTFGVEADYLAELVLMGQKTATSSAFDLYAVGNEPLPKENELSVILDSRENAICIIETTKVEVIPFKDVSEYHAYKEGEGDCGLTYWRELHEDLFSKWLHEVGLHFSQDSLVVLEEFRVVYPID